MNCSKSNDIYMMQQLFTGQVCTGSWLVLDEFNRIDIEVLCVIASQLNVIREAQMDKKQNFEFFGQLIPVNHSIGTFITYNPDYKDRTKIPDNINQLFRPISMVLPDYQIVSENLLYSYGFSSAPELSKKISTVFQICATQFQSGQHYDFGMRSLKNIIMMGGDMRKKDKLLSDQLIIYNSIVIQCKPRLIQNDFQYLSDILKDMFTEIQLNEINQPQLRQVVEESFQELNVESNPEVINKVLQIFDIIQFRSGTCIMGESNCGKSTLLKVTKRSFNKMNYIIDQKIPKIIAKVLNPKMLTSDQMMGCMRQVSQLWQDGVFSGILREMSNWNNELQHFWITLDGPQDSLWIENLNTLLDDTKTLTLSNGERIKSNDRIKMLFETNEMNNVSPATISRLGVVYLESNIVEPIQIFHSQFKKLPQEQVQLEFIKNFMDENLEQIISMVKKLGSPFQDKINSLISKFFTFVEYFYVHTPFSTAHLINASKLRFNVSKKVLYFCLCWGFGSHLFEDQQLSFLDQVNQYEMFQDIASTKTFQSFLQYENRHECKLIHDTKQIQSFQINKDGDFYDQIVETPQILTFKQIIKINVTMQKPIFMTGLSGNGKSIITRKSIKNIQDSIQFKFNVFSSSINVQDVDQRLQEQMINQRKDGKIFISPKSSQPFLFIIDDVNLVSSDKYGSQPPIEYLRFQVDKNAIYDVNNLQFKMVKNLIQLLIAPHSFGGRADLSSRLTRHFNIFNVNKMDANLIQTIFETIMEQYLKSNAFKAELQDDVKDLINATITLVDRLSKKFQITFKKPHYFFTNADISRQIQGLFLSTALTIENRRDYILLWYHESKRAFSDRLINQADKQIFDDIIDDILINNLKFKEKLSKNEIYVDFMHREIGLGKKFYERQTDHQKLINVIQSVMQNDTQINIVIFQYACDHICRICRIIMLQNGHMLLVGGEGQGKKSLIEMACAIRNLDLNSIMIIPSFRQKDFRQEFVTHIQKAANAEQPYILYIEDQNYDNDIFIEDIYIFLSSGDIVHMISKEEQENISNRFKSQAQENQDPYQLFLQKIKNQFHIMISQSPIGQQFYRRLRKFPNFSNYFTVDWMIDLNQEAIQEFTYQYLYKNQTINTDEENFQKICQVKSFFQIKLQENVQNFQYSEKTFVYFSIKKYIDYLKEYEKYIIIRRDLIQNERNKLTNGLNKLKEANENTGDLKRKIIDLQPILQEKNTQIKQLITKLTNDQLQANMAKKQVEQEANDVNIQQEKIMILKSEAEIILKEALPIFQTASEQLDKLNRSDLSEVKNNNNPHALVKYAMECVAIALEEKTDWDHIKKNILSDTSLLGKLKNLNLQKMGQNTKDKIKKKLQTNPNFIPSELKSINQAGKSFCEWIHAVNNFNDIYKEILLKRENCNQMDIKLKDANEKLQIKQKELDEIQSKVEELEQTYNSTKEEKDVLDQEIKQAEERLARANQLSEGLQEEQKKWVQKSKLLMKELDMIFGDCMCIITDLVYNSVFTKIYRQENIDNLQKLNQQFNLGFYPENNLLNLLTDSSEIFSWTKKGLSPDQSNIHNAILLLKSPFYPYIIDPQNVATNFLKQHMGGENGLKFVSCKIQKFKRTVEEALTSGHQILIYDIDEDVPKFVLDILQNDVKTISNTHQIKIEDDFVKFNPKFYMYLQTPQTNTYIHPKVFNNAQVLNFMVSKEGLQDQLFTIVIEQYSIEEKKIRQEIINQVKSDKDIIIQGEEKILTLLQNSKGLLLDDIDLIEQLKISKELSKAIEEKIVLSQKKEKEIEASLNNYRFISDYGTTLFFTIQKLQNLNPIYKYSLQFFLQIFKYTIQNIEVSNNEDDDDNRNKLDKDFISSQLILNIVEIIQAGLFNKDKHVFHFLLTIQIMISQGLVSDREIQIFLNNKIFKSEQIEEVPNDLNVDQQSWNNLISLRQQFQEYIEVVRHIQNNPKEWSSYFNSNQIHMIDPPCKLSEFQRLQLVRLFNPLYSIDIVDQMISKNLGDQISVKSNIDFESLYSFLNLQTYVVILIKPGQDSETMFKQCQKQIDYPSQAIYQVSLGQGQQQLAEQNMQEAMKIGGWMFFENFHLAQSFYPILINKIEQFPELLIDQKMNDDFKMFFSVEECDHLPHRIIQNSLKLSSEPPIGVKQNIIKNINKLQGKRPPLHDIVEPNKFKLIFSLILMHSVIAERYKFGPVGFSIPYLFSPSDLRQSIFVIHRLISFYQYIPWNEIQYILSRIVYGGRIQNNQDQMIIESTVRKFINKNIMDEDYKFDSKEQYVNQQFKNLQGIVDYIQEKEDIEILELYGLDDTAENIYKSKQIDEFFKQIKINLSLSKNRKDDQYIADQFKAQIQTIMDEIPKDIDMEEFQGDQDNALFKFMCSEIVKFNQMLAHFKQIMDQIHKSIVGQYLLSEELQQIKDEIQNGIVSWQFKKNWYPSEKKFGQWFQDFKKRHKYFSSWITAVVFPFSFWLPGLFYPNGFLGSILQNHSRQTKKSLDQFKFEFYVESSHNKESIDQKPNEGCYIFGLFSENFFLDVKNQGNYIMNTQQRNKVYYDMPIIHLIPKVIDAAVSKGIKIPIYRTVTRQGDLTTTGQSNNYILDLLFDSNQNLDFWVLRGIAIVCELPT